MTPTIPEWFAGKSVFITGATGFMGKALIEKLLRSCPKIGTIYCLMRPKKGKQLSERLEVLTNDVLFERLKKEQPTLKMNEKIIPLAGDMVQLGLGLSSEDRKLLTENVNIIFHVAASVRFDDPLADAVILNVRGTREVCQLALDTKNLAVHVHVSTAFANCDRPEANEILYPPKCDWRQIIEISEKFDKHTLAALTEKYMDRMPNTYCYTKNVAEHVVNDMCKGKIPAKIFRPSIVVSSLREEPVRGWIDNFNGPVGILTAYGKGIMRTTYAHDQYKPDYIPVDVVTKALVISAWELGLRGARGEPEVIQCTCHNVAEWLRPSIKQMASDAIKVNKETPLNDMIWPPSQHTTNSPLVWWIYTVLFMLIPALLVDGILKIMGKKPMLTRLQRKIYVAQLALRHFMTNEWMYSNDKLLALQTRIDPRDTADWDFEFRQYNMLDYMQYCIIGCRRYLLNESDETLPRARAHYRRMRVLERVVHVAAVALFLWLVARATGIVQLVS